MRLIVLALLALPAAAQTCTPNATQQAAQQTLALQAKLLASPSPQMDTDVPAAIKPLLHDYKQSLLRTIDTAVVCNHPDPTQLQSGLAALLHANQPDKPFVSAPPGTKADDNQPETGDYGGSLKIDVKPVVGQPDLYSIQVSYEVECGDDNMLLLYRHTPQGYRRELAWFNPDLNSVGDALGGVFAFAPAPAPEPAFVIVSGTPWCTSNMSVFKADLVAPATPAKPQHLIAHMTRDYRREDFAFKSRTDGFELRTWVNSVDSNDVMRPAILRYTTTSGRFVLQPVALNAQAFVDMWLGSEWSTIQSWSDPAKAARLKQQHDNLNDEGDYFTSVSGFGPTLACGANHYQVELEILSDHANAQREVANFPSQYAQVRTNANSFTLLDVTDKADPACKGPDLMQSARKKPGL